MKGKEKSEIAVSNKTLHSKNKDHGIQSHAMGNNGNSDRLYFGAPKSLQMVTAAMKLKDASVQFSHLVVSNSLRPHESQQARPPCPSPTPGVHSLTSIESVMPSSHLILCCPLLLLPPIPHSIRVFSSESTLRMRRPK